MRLIQMLLIALILTVAFGVSLQAKDPPHKDTCPQITQEYDKCIMTLKQYRDLVRLEQKRWKKLHANPIDDIILVEDTKENVIIRIKIKSKVNTIINDQAITRKYTLQRIRADPRNNFWKSINLSLIASYNYNTGFRPAFAAGFRPFSLIKNSGFFSGIGIGGYTNITSTGASLYYAFQKLPLTIHFLMGSTYDGKPTPGCGIGLYF